MTRPLLHLLLALTLALNGVSAPWAMARMKHVSHASHDMPAPDFSAPAQPEASALTQHAHHAEAASGTDPGPTPSPTDDPCLDGTSCPCGGVQSPDVLVVALVLTPPPSAETRFVFSAQHAALRHDSPPFRPPAV